MDVAVIIRAAGERTLDLCRALVERQVPPGQVQVVQAAPFEAALRQCYEKGIAAGAKWTLTLDADVLVRPGAVADLVSFGESCEQNLFHLSSMAYDWLLLCDRNAGTRLYRTRLLSELVGCIPETGTAIRPEDQTIKNLAGRGLRSVVLRSVTSVHDYEQYYRDIYRKAALHAHKHLSMVSALVSQWKKLSREDPDYLVAIKGYCDGLQADTAPALDMRTFQDIDEILRQLGLWEKAELETGLAEVCNYEGFVEQTILRHCGGRTHLQSLVGRFRRVTMERGLPFALRQSLAWTIRSGAGKLNALGNWIERGRI